MGLHVRRVNVRNQQGIKLFIVLLMCTVFMYSFSHFGALAYNAINTDGALYKNGTSVGSIDLTGKTKDEARVLLAEKQQTWLSESKLQIQYKEKTVPIDTAIYQFDLDNTVKGIVDGQKSPILVTIKKNHIQNILKQVSVGLTLTKEEFNKLNGELLQYASGFISGNQPIYLENLLSTANNQETINQVELTLYGITVEMGDWIDTLSPIVIEPNAKVSLLKHFEEKQLSSMPDSIKSMIATGIYETIIPTNFPIIERQTSQFLPEYAKLGFEVQLDVKNHRDLLFANPNSSSYQLELDWKDNTLVIQLKGSKFLYDYKAKLGEVQQFKPKTIVQYNPLIQSGIRVQQEGTDGLMVKVYREVNDETGVQLQKELIAEDYYPPVHRIEVHRLQSTSPTGETGTNTNPNEPTGTKPTTGGTTPTSQSPDDAKEEELWGKPNEAKK